MSNSKAMFDPLRRGIARIERLTVEKDEIAEDIRGVYAELKAQGYDPKIVRKVVALRKKDKYERDEEQRMIDEYMDALRDMPE